MVDVVEEVLSPYENAVNYLSVVNQKLVEYNVTDEDGTPAQFTQQASSPAWLFALSQGSIFTYWQHLLRVAYNALDVSSCTEPQLFNIATLMGEKINEGEHSNAQVKLYNSHTQPIQVDSGIELTDSTSGKKWSLIGTHVIQPKNEVLAYIVCMETGAVELPADTSMDLPTDNKDYANITCNSTMTAKLGTVRESINEFRARLILGESKADRISQCEAAISHLFGINTCKIFFNNAINSQMPLEGGISVPPRTAFIAIQGIDSTNSLASTFYKYLNVSTHNHNNTAEIAHYVRGGTDIPVYYHFCGYTPVYIKLKCTRITLESNKNAISSALNKFSGKLAIGEKVSEAYILACLANYARDYIVSCDLSLDQSDWQDEVAIPALNLAIWGANTISFETE